MTNTQRDLYLQDVDTLTEAQTLYTNGEATPLTDDEFDLLLEQVKSVGASNGWVEHEPLLEVNGGVSNDAADMAGRGTYKHLRRMLSLKKAAQMKDLDNFITGKVNDKMVLEPKMDGIALVVVYVDGKLSVIATRGDSNVGQNITEQVQHAKLVKGLPATVSMPGRVEVRGEIVMSAEDFTIAQTERAEENRKLVEEHLKSKKTPLLADPLPPFKNPRNTTAGAVMSINPDKIRALTLTFVAYDADIEHVGEDSYTQAVQKLSNEGFITALSTVPAALRHMNITDGVKAFEKVRETFPYPTDGAVIKVDSFARRAELGEGSHTPYWAIAYKYPATVKQTVLRDIVRAVGRTGAISYTALLDPVELDGSEVSKATLNNVRFIQALDLRIGDTVHIRKANDIIPEIMKVEQTPMRMNVTTPYTVITTCPNCEEELDQSSIVWRCSNFECARINYLTHAFSRDALDVDGLSGKILTFLMDAGLVETINDVYKLTKDDIATTWTGRLTTEGEKILIGEATAATLVENLNASKAQPLNRILVSLGVRHMGRTVSKQLAWNLLSLRAVQDATEEELKAVIPTGNFAHIIHTQLKTRHEDIDGFYVNGFYNLTHNPDSIGGSESLKGENIVVTGAVPGYSRNEVKELIEKNGGVAGGSVSGKTTLVVAPADERDSTKAKKAASLGVTIITPEEFLQKVTA